jgi:hypothetical protein
MDVSILSDKEYKKWRRERLAWRNELRNGGCLTESSWVNKELDEAASVRKPLGKPMSYDWKILQNGLQVAGGFAPSAEQRDRQVGYYMTSYASEGPIIVKIRDGVKGRWIRMEMNDGS